MFTARQIISAMDRYRSGYVLCYLYLHMHELIMSEASKDTLVQWYEAVTAEDLNAPDFEERAKAVLDQLQ